MWCLHLQDTTASNLTISVTFKEEAECSPEMSEHLITAQCRNPKQYHHLKNSRSENMKKSINIIC
jgi:hypothetical protein